MDESDIIDNELVDKFDAEDTIFNNCMNDFDKFPSCITGHDDIIGHYSQRFMSPDFKNLNMDSVWQRKNKSLDNIEHHSEITSYTNRRDYNYITTIHNATNQIVNPFIFNTGRIPLKTVEYANSTMFYNPTIFHTRERLGIANLNNLRYKVLTKSELTQEDALDLIWLMTSDIDMDSEDLLMELTTEIWAKAVAEKWLLDAVRKNLIIWAGKYLISEEKIQIFKEAVKMSKLEVRSLDRALRGAVIAGRLERAEEKGLKEGLKEGKETTENLFISKLLKKHSPEEISTEYEIPIQRILEIQNDNS